MRGAAGKWGEVFVAKGEPLPDFERLLFINNAGQKPDAVECSLRSVDYMQREIAPYLFELHWREVAQDKGWQQDPNWDYYRALEAANMLRIVALTVNSIPVGYFVFIVSQSLHYRTKHLASSDMFYILPQYRAQYAVRLFRAAERFAKEAGAGKMYIAFKIYKDILPLTKRLGFSHIEDVVVKSLE